MLLKYIMSFLDTGELCMDYGYKSGDLIHYKISDKSLDEGLRLLSSNHDVNEMISHHVRHGLAELYLVSFHSSNADIEDDNAKEDEEYKKIVVYKKDDLWDEVLNVDTDDDNDSYGKEQIESKKVGVSVVVEDEEDRDEDANANEEDIGEDANNRDGEETVEEDYGGDDGNSEDLCPSDILRSPSPNDSEDEEISSHPNVTKMILFTKEDMKNPVL
jgi:hypothetical protein